MWSWGHSELAGTLLCQQHQHLQWKVGVLSWAKASRPPAPTMEQQEGRGAALPSRRGLLGGPAAASLQPAVCLRFFGRISKPSE